MSKTFSLIAETGLLFTPFIFCGNCPLSDWPKQPVSHCSTIDVILYFRMFHSRCLDLVLEYTDSCSPVTPTVELHVCPGLHMFTQRLRFPESLFCGQIFHELMLHYRPVRALEQILSWLWTLQMCHTLSTLAQTCNSMSSPLELRRKKEPARRKMWLSSEESIKGCGV